MRAMLRKAVRPLKRRLRQHLLGPQFADEYPPDIGPEERALIAEVWPIYTMTSVERLYALIEAVRYIEDRGIPGTFVECGVWRGGSMMAVAKTLLGHRGPTRDLYLYDTFEGMPAPDTHDQDYQDQEAKALMDVAPPDEERGVRCIAMLPDVQANLRSTGYPTDRIQWIQGLVEATIPARVPDRIALLRLDTDWYESTKHELTHLYPRLSPGGLLIIDDYGHWKGARKAVDEFLASLQTRPYLHRIDYAGRLIIKPTE